MYLKILTKKKKNYMVIRNISDGKLSMGKEQLSKKQLSFKKRKIK